MANLSYCRFRNTAEALLDCKRHLEDELPADEHKARELLIKYARVIVLVADAGRVPIQSESEAK